MSGIEHTIMDEVASGPPAEREPITARLGVRPLRRIRNFLLTHRRIARDALLQRKRRLVTITTISVLGALAQGSTVGCLLLFVKVMGSTIETGYAALDAVLANRGLMLALLIVAIVCLQLFSACSAYFAAVQCRTLGRDYHAASLTRLFDLLRRSPSLNGASGPAPTETELNRLALAGSRFMGLTVETLAESIHPTLYILVSFAILLSLDVQSTLIIIPLLLLLATALYKISSRIQGVANEYLTEVGQTMNRRVRSELRSVNFTNVGGRPPAQPACFADTTEVRTFLSVLDDMILAGHRTSFVTAVFKPVMLAVVIGLLGWQALGGTISWGTVVAYVVALIYFVNSVQALGGALTRLNRFYPLITKWIRFEEDAAVDAPATASEARLARDEPATPFEIKARERNAHGQRKATIEPGARILLHREMELSRACLRAFVAPLVRSSSLPASMWTSVPFVSYRYVGLRASLALNLARPVDSSDLHEAAKRVAAALGLDGEVNALPQGLETAITDELWPGLSPNLQAAVRIAPLSFTAHPLCLIDQRIFHALEPEFVEVLLSLFAKRSVLVTTQQWQARGFEPDMAWIVDDKRIMSFGDLEWLAAAAPSWAGAAPDPEAAAFAFTAAEDDAEM